MSDPYHHPHPIVHWAGWRCSQSYHISLQKPTLYYFLESSGLAGPDTFHSYNLQPCLAARLFVCSLARSLAVNPLLSLLNLLVLLFLAQWRIIARLRDILSLLDSWSSGDTVYPGLFQQISQIPVGVFRMDEQGRGCGRREDGRTGGTHT